MNFFGLHEYEKKTKINSTSIAKYWLWILHTHTHIQRVPHSNTILKWSMIQCK